MTLNPFTVHLISWPPIVSNIQQNTFSIYKKVLEKFKNHYFSWDLKLMLLKNKKKGKLSLSLLILSICPNKFKYMYIYVYVRVCAFMYICVYMSRWAPLCPLPGATLATQETVEILPSHF